MAGESKSMEVDSFDARNFSAPSSKENLLITRRVATGSSGIGLPYAPVDWPCPGDIWTWRVGKRKSISGHFVDRSIHPPSRLRSNPSIKSGFYSRHSLEQYFQKEFPEADVNAFFASFVWKVPAAYHDQKEEAERSISESPRVLAVNGHSKHEPTNVPGECKAGNKMCSLRAKAIGCTLAVKSCDICCSESGFCQNCCCILCSETVDWSHGGHSYIRCEAIVDENFICGHVVHVDCALRAYLAGKVEGKIDLDAHYYCRRCDNRTDLLPLVTKLIRNCKSLDSRNHIEQNLNLGICILRGSERERAKKLQDHITLIMTKLKNGISLCDIWSEEDNESTVTAGVSSLGNRVSVLGKVDMTRSNSTNADSMDDIKYSSETDAIDGRAQNETFVMSSHSNASVNLENEVERALQELKRSQEAEFLLAEQKLFAQKDFLLGLYQQLETERSELANSPPLPNCNKSDNLLNDVMERVDQIKHNEVKLQQMLKIAEGFGRVTKNILVEHFQFTL